MDLNLITDRTQADVARWRTLKAKGYSSMSTSELSEWFSGMKGSYNATDLNRVGEALIYLSDRLAEWDYHVTVTPKTDWTMKDIPTPNDLENYLEQVSIIRSVLPLFQSTPDVPPDMKNLTYQKANAIEQILLDIETYIDRVAKSFKRTAQFTLWSGNQPLPAAESDVGRNWEKLDAMNTTWRNWQVADWYLLLYGNLKAEGDVE